ncbi:hypothetical protein HNQ94_001068 [Salirhabdus euzebyi]|uniref:Uncharacterized protein n=1 Tax=Salirhabdus euzebyi TaxID=394506 RepID=A0A841Q2A8_9BACI|nr:hypothetical protein [Salirhabdus euzebyi]MBB6452622.1 hypothetical protein [Salirhabdus euzebyi]
MKFKNIIILLSVCLNILFGCLFFNESIKKDPLDVGLSFKEAVRVENYALAKTFIAKGRDEYISDEKLKKVNEVMGTGTSFTTYELLEFDNGEMVLLNLTTNNNYEIQDIIIIPEDLKFIFK